MSSFNEANLMKKLENVTSSQESIQSLSLWILHYQKYYKKIVEHWLKCYAKDKSDHQLVLFYLANDIVQNAKKKNLSNYLNEFMHALREACKITSDEKIFNNINRVLNIWQDRSIYQKEFINELRELLLNCNENLIEKEIIEKIIKNFNINELLNQINNIDNIEKMTRTKYQNLLNYKLEDLNNQELLYKLKDKAYGEQFKKELDDTIKYLESTKSAIEKEINNRKNLITLLEKSKIYYDIQMKECKQIAETFNNCEVNIKQVQTMLTTKYGDRFSSLNSNTNDNNKNNLIEMNTSQLSSVLNFFQQQQQQQTNNQQQQQISSLDKRLTSLMSGSGQFQLNPLVTSPSVQIANTKFDNNNNNNINIPRDFNRIESLITQRLFGNENPVENFELADMDLSDSEDEQHEHRQHSSLTSLAADSSQKLSSSMLPPSLSSFIGGQDLASAYCFIPPPPPPPPMPPPELKEFLNSKIDNNDLDTFHHQPSSSSSKPSLPSTSSMITPNIPSQIVIDVNKFQTQQQQQGDAIKSISPSNRHGHHHHHHHHHHHNHHNRNSISSSSSSMNNNRYSQNNRYGQNYSNNNNNIRQQQNTSNRWKNGGSGGGGGGGNTNWKRY